MTGPSVAILPTDYLTIPADSAPNEEWDAYSLFEALTTFIAMIPRNGNYPHHEVVRALEYEGIRGWENGFLLLTKSEIESLTVPATYVRLPPGDPDVARDGILRNMYGTKVVDQEARSLPAPYKTQLKTLLAYYHFQSRKAGKSADIMGCPIDEWNEFRLSYDADSPISNFRKPDKATTDALITWRKAVQPSRSDIEELKKDFYWPIWRDRFLKYLKSCGLLHLLQKGYTPTNAELHAMQLAWLMVTFDKKVLIAILRTIIIELRDSDDCPELWERMNTTMDGTMSTEICLSSLATFITSTRLAQANWRSTQQRWISEYYTQVKFYQKIAGADRQFHPMHLVSFAQQAVNGVPNLEQALQTWKIQNTAVGRAAIPLDFETAIQILLQSAQIYDAKNQRGTPRGMREVNKAEFDSEGYDLDDLEPELDEYGIIEACVMDSRGTPSGNAYVNKDTWQQISQEDRNAWTKISIAGRSAILGKSSTTVNKTQSTSNNKSTGNQKRSFNVHEVEEIPQEPEALETNMHEKKSEGMVEKNSNVEVSTHHITSATKEPSIEDIATKTYNQKEGIDICQVLSQKSKSPNPRKVRIGVHEIDTKYNQTIMNAQLTDYDKYLQEEPNDPYDIDWHFSEDEDDSTAPDQKNFHLEVNMASRSGQNDARRRLAAIRDQQRSLEEYDEEPSSDGNPTSSDDTEDENVPYRTPNRSYLTSGREEHVPRASTHTGFGLMGTPFNLGNQFSSVTTQEPVTSSTRHNMMASSTRHLPSTRHDMMMSSTRHLFHGSPDTDERQTHRDPSIQTQPRLDTQATTSAMEARRARLLRTAGAIPVPPKPSPRALPPSESSGPSNNDPPKATAMVPHKGTALAARKARLSKTKEVKDPPVEHPDDSIPRLSAKYGHMPKPDPPRWMQSKHVPTPNNEIPKLSDRRQLLSAMAKASQGAAIKSPAPSLDHKDSEPERISPHRHFSNEPYVDEDITYYPSDSTIIMSMSEYKQAKAAGLLDRSSFNIANMLNMGECNDDASVIELQDMTEGELQRILCMFTRIYPFASATSIRKHIKSNVAIKEQSDNQRVFIVDETLNKGLSEMESIKKQREQILEDLEELRARQDALIDTYNTLTGDTYQSPINFDRLYENSDEEDGVDLGFYPADPEPRVPTTEQGIQTDPITPERNKNQENEIAVATPAGSLAASSLTNTKTPSDHGGHAQDDHTNHQSVVNRTPKSDTAVNYSGNWIEVTRRNKKSPSNKGSTNHNPTDDKPVVRESNPTGTPPIQRQTGAAWDTPYGEKNRTIIGDHNLVMDRDRSMKQVRRTPASKIVSLFGCGVPEASDDSTSTGNRSNQKAKSTNTQDPPQTQTKKSSKNNQNRQSPSGRGNNQGGRGQNKGGRGHNHGGRGNNKKTSTSPGQGKPNSDRKQNPNPKQGGKDFGKGGSE